MIPIIRSLSELMAITESRDNEKAFTDSNEDYVPALDSGQRKRYIKSLVPREVELPKLNKTLRTKWMRKKEFISRFIDDLDYNNQIQSSYDLTLIERQNKKTQQDVA